MKVHLEFFMAAVLTTLHEKRQLVPEAIHAMNLAPELCAYFYGPHTSGKIQIAKDIHAGLAQMTIVYIDEPDVHNVPMDAHKIIVSMFPPENNPKVAGIVIDRVVRFEGVHDEFLFEAVEIVEFDLE